MGIQANENFVHWNYYIALEQDLSNVARFIEFSEINFRTYSIELAHLLLASSSEVDVVLKALCNMKNSAINHQNINQYKGTVAEYCREIINEKCYVPRYGLELTPWINWAGENNPIWWHSYNDVKHQRDVHFNKANLENTLNSISALKIVILYYYREIFTQAGEEHEFRDVSRRLQSEAEASLIKFSDNYYYSNLIV